MIATPPAYRDWLTSAASWDIWAEWTRDGKEWHRVELADETNTVTEDTTQQTRWSTILTLAEAPTGRDGLSDKGGRIRVRMLQRESGARFLKGEFRIESIETSLQSSKVQIKGYSAERQIMDDRLTAPFVMPKTTAQQAIKTMIHRTYPNAPISWRVDASLVLPETVIEREVWKYLDGNSESKSVARALGARIYVNYAGQWVVAPVSSLADEPAWRLSTNDVELDATLTTSRTSVRNVVSASGVSMDPNVPNVGPGVVWDADPLSDTYALKPVAEGGFGKVPLFYASPFLVTVEQCINTARSMLAPRLGEKREMRFTGIFDPSIEAGDVGVIESPDSDSEKVVVDSVSLDLVEMTLEAQTRATSSRQAGEVAAFTNGEDIDVSLE